MARSLVAAGMLVLAALLVAVADAARADSPLSASAIVDSGRHLVVTYTAPDTMQYGGHVYLDDDLRDPTQLSGSPLYGQFMYCNDQSTCKASFPLTTNNGTGPFTYTSAALSCTSFPAGTWYVQVEGYNQDPFPSTRQWEESPVITVTLPPCSSTQADFTLTAAPTTVSVNAGSQVQVTLSWAAVGGYTWGGSLSTVGGGPIGLPPGASASSPGGTGSAVWTITTAPSTRPGDYTVTWTVTDGKKTHTAGVTLTVASSGGGTTTGANELPWPPLPDSTVTLASVSNGCGPGKASSAPQHLDTWNLGGGRTVNFREACNVHDAGYSGARVADPLNGGTIDTFAWTKEMVDQAFLRNLRKICTDTIPPTSWSSCFVRAAGLYHGVANVVSEWLGVYRARPKLAGLWSGPGVSVFTATQNGRLFNAQWSEGNIVGEIRGIIISRDQDSVIKGYAHTTVNGVTKQYAISMIANPDKPDELFVNGGGSGLPGTLTRGL